MNSERASKQDSNMAESSASTEATFTHADLFVRCDRARDLYLARGILGIHNFYMTREVELSPRGREILTSTSSESTWRAFSKSFVGVNQVCWLGEEICIARTGSSLKDTLGYHALGFLKILLIMMMKSPYSDKGLEVWAHHQLPVTRVRAAYDLVLHQLESCDAYSLKISPDRVAMGCPSCRFSGLALSRFLTRRRANQQLQLRDFKFNKDQCRALVAEIREDREFELIGCVFKTKGAEQVLFDGIRLNCGPSTLCGCSFLDSLPLANVLRGNSSLKRIYLGHPFMTNAAKQSFANALGENLGVTHFHLCLVPIDDESWKNMCESLANHTKLEDLDLTDSNSGGCSVHRTRCLVDLLKVNHVLTKIGCSTYHFQVQMEIYPWLEMNKHRPRITAVAKAGETLRAPLLGRALHEVSDDNTLLYMYLKGNVDLLDVHARLERRRVRRRLR